MSNSHLDKAIDCLQTREIGELAPETPYVKQNLRPNFNYHIEELTDEVPFDSDDQKISEKSVVNSVEKIVKDVARDGDPASSYRTQIQEYASEIICSEMEEYTVYFALNLQDLQPIWSQFEIDGHRMDRISVKEWKNRLKDAREDESVDSTIVQSQAQLTSEKHTYWKCGIKARDGIFATNSVLELVRSLLGKILYTFKRWRLVNAWRPDDLRSVRPSRVEEPWMLLGFENEHFEHCRITDYEYREPVSLPWANSEYTDTLEEIPSLNSSCEYDNLLKNAFEAYYYAMSSKNTNQSFFTFLRGAEYLSRKDASESADEVVDRGLFAYDRVSHAETSDRFENIVSDFRNKRNKLAHEGMHVNVSKRQQQYAKILMDSLLTLYIISYDEFSMAEMDDFLRYGPRSFKKQDLTERYEDISSPHLENSS